VIVLDSGSNQRTSAVSSGSRGYAVAGAWLALGISAQPHLAALRRVRKPRRDPECHARTILAIAPGIPRGLTHARGEVTLTAAARRPGGAIPPLFRPLSQPTQYETCQKGELESHSGCARWRTTEMRRGRIRSSSFP
jgi:hypothetical protein